MSHASKNNWQPNASILHLKKRAKIISAIRNFFADKNVLEVQTPTMAVHGASDPFIQSIKTENGMFLQTSPEYHMKRLIAADSGAIFQICKSFRYEEKGRIHNPEFTMLEWYQPGYDHHDLMNEMDELLQRVLNTDSAEKISYQDIFLQHLNINPHTAKCDELKQCVTYHNINSADFQDKDDWLNLLLTHLIEPELGIEQPVFIYDYPASQSALAKIRKDNFPVAERFEAYYQGIELANGFHELNDTNEQRERFLNNNRHRTQMGLPEIPLDEQLLAALEHGLPDCAGVALGIDRLVMLACQASSIDQTISFCESHIIPAGNTKRGTSQ